MTKQLSYYAEELPFLKANHKDTKHLCNTLWIPIYSGNRTACINLNHQIIGFDKNGILWGENGNCSTPYVILEIPDWFNNHHLEILSEKIAKRLGKEEDYPIARVLKADDRLPIIIEELNDLVESMKK